MLDTCIFDRTGSGAEEIFENRLIQINYPNSGNNSQFTYDSFDHMVAIVETSAGTVTSTKQIVWAQKMCEARNAAGALTAQYFDFGQTIQGTAYFYSVDHLASVHEMTTETGTLVTEYGYDAFGRTTKTTESVPSDFKFARYYFHSPSGMSIANFRFYSSSLGRWISRDPIGTVGGMNLYAYVGNVPTQYTDLSGLAPSFVVPYIPSVDPYGTDAMTACACQNICKDAGSPIKKAICFLACIDEAYKQRRDVEEYHKWLQQGPPPAAPPIQQIPDQPVGPPPVPIERGPTIPEPGPQPTRPSP